MDPIGRQLNPEESRLLTVLLQDGRSPTTAPPRDRDVARTRPARRRRRPRPTERDGLTASEATADGDESWSVRASL